MIWIGRMRAAEWLVIAGLVLLGFLLAKSGGGAWRGVVWYPTLTFALLWIVFRVFPDPENPRFVDVVAKAAFLRRNAGLLERILFSAAFASLLVSLLKPEMFFLFLVPMLVVAAKREQVTLFDLEGRAVGFVLFALLSLLLLHLPFGEPVAGWRYLFGVIAFWLFAWAANEAFATTPASATAGGRIAAASWLGIAILLIWQMVVRGFDVPLVILPAPSDIAGAIAGNLPVLWADFVQTFVKGTLSGYVIGCGAAFLTAVAIDRSPFLQRGLLPVGNFVAALPIIGTAPILVMWFGFDWQSKAAVVVVMVFFPVLVNTVQGLAEASAMQKDLMRTYAAGYWPTLVKLRLPAAMPFVFNGLKIASTLALIGAIVAEFFGSPIVGMGFRISTSVGQLALDLVWAEITVAAIAGSLFYGAVALAERWVTFWHPSQRKT